MYNLPHPWNALELSGQASSQVKVQDEVKHEVIDEVKDEVKDNIKDDVNGVQYSTAEDNKNLLYKRLHVAAIPAASCPPGITSYLSRCSFPQTCRALAFEKAPSNAFT